jgi:hypothetical protein
MDKTLPEICGEGADVKLGCTENSPFSLPVPRDNSECILPAHRADTPEESLAVPVDANADPNFFSVGISTWCMAGANSTALQLHVQIEGMSIIACYVLYLHWEVINASLIHHCM